MTLYPAGTSLSDIASFDRSTKVVFHCTEHPEIQYRSKDPFVSQWFPANNTAYAIADGTMKDPCAHTFKNHAGWVISFDYES